MKAYKVELLIIDFDNLGPEGIKQEIEHNRYANDCMFPEVKNIDERDLGEWTDDHPLNQRATANAEYKRLWPTSTTI